MKALCWAGFVGILLLHQLFLQEIHFVSSSTLMDLKLFLDSALCTQLLKILLQRSFLVRNKVK